MAGRKSMIEKVTTSVRIPKADMSMVSEIAHGLGLEIKTGGVQGRPGNVSALLELLAQAGRNDKKQTLTLLQAIQELAKRKPDEGEVT